jgi:hypothetical protein
MEKRHQRLWDLLTVSLAETCKLHESVGDCEACARRREVLWAMLFTYRRLVRKALKE